MIVKEVTAILEELAPLAYAEDFDNVGLLVGNEENEVSGILVTLDTLENVVDEAIANDCNLILFKALQNNIAIYSMHTALDNSLDGVNAKICEVLGLENPEILIPKKDSDEPIGMGMVGYLKNPMNETQFLAHVKKTMNASCIRHSELLGKPVQKIAVLGGSGAFAISAAKAAGADVFITADVKYHQFYEAEDKVFPFIGKQNQSNQVFIDMAKKAEATVEDKLRALYDLQLIDSRVDEIRNVRGELPLEVEDLANEVLGLKTRMDKLKTDVETINFEITAKKNLIDESKALIKKYTEQQKNVRNSREFNSITKELEFQELEIQLAEKNIKEFKAQIDQKKVVVSETKERLGERETHLKHKKGELNEILAETEKEEQALLGKSEKFQKDIEERLVKALRSYQKKC
ncbi:GTP cyclohydrolase 1 type 2 [Nymphon striatum]|nr:GTP cyclohydrolase 1 type 2 [Nymphon striatum]